MASVMGPLWPHYGPMASKRISDAKPLIQLGFAGARVTCFIMDKPKARPGFAGTRLDGGKLIAESITLTHERPHAFGATE